MDEQYMHKTAAKETSKQQLNKWPNLHYISSLSANGANGSRLKWVRIEFKVKTAVSSE